jgi:hypothetical protein
MGASTFNAHQQVYVTSLRRENARYRDRANALQKSNDALTREVAKLEQALIKAAVLAEALQLGVVAPPIANLADLSACDVIDGEVAGAREAALQLRRDKPHFFGGK